VTSDLEEQKRKVVAQATSLVGEWLGTSESPVGDGFDAAAAQEFVATFYEHAPPADIVACGVAHLAGGALALWRFAARRTRGEALVRVYNPTVAKDGWASDHTIVEIVNDDMPFLVDSVSAAINDRGRRFGWSSILSSR